MYYMVKATTKVSRDGRKEVENDQKVCVEEIVEVKVNLKRSRYV